MPQRPTIPALVLALSVLAASTAAAGGEPRTHDGFFLRLSAGGGAASASIDDASGSLDLDGSGTGDVNFAIGAAVKPNLILHATLWGWLMSDPDVSGSFGSGTLNGDVDMSAFGGGLTYYFMPVNIYLSGSAGFGTLSIDSGPIQGETDSGFVMDLTLGKEWWVGGSWGLGVAGAFGYHSIPDGSVDADWTGTSWAVRFTATLN